jgi:uncharacterized protein (TIGR01777 family)
MRIAVTGASGFIGRRVCAELRAGGHEILTLGRTSGERRWDPAAGPAPLDGTDAVVHLAGEPVASGRWTEEKMRRIRDSRVTGTRNLVAGIGPGGPRILVCASATGYYGDRGDEELTEDSAPGNDFLAGVCRDWEAEAARSGVRTASIRIGLALGAEGGALPRMLLPFRLGLGGRLGSGRQWMSWIHADDLAALVRHAVEKDSVSGPLLGTSPVPATNAEFTRALGRALGRWTILPMPGWQVRLLFGKVASVLLGGQRCRPARTLASGFAFRHPELGPAFAQILAAAPDSP